MTLQATRRIGAITLLIVLVDQITKRIAVHHLDLWDERIVLDGFFKFVHWGNTGAAWSLFHGHNERLAILSGLALAAILLLRSFFDTRGWLGQVSLACILGGVTGNLLDRLFVNHVIDFLRFYLYQRGGDEIGFPAFNVADVAICVGVGLLFILSWQGKDQTSALPQTQPRR